MSAPPSNPVVQQFIKSSLRAETWHPEPRKESAEEKEEQRDPQGDARWREQRDRGPFMALPGDPGAPGSRDPRGGGAARAASSPLPLSPRAAPQLPSPPRTGRTPARAPRSEARAPTTPLRTWVPWGPWRCSGPSSPAGLTRRPGDRARGRSLPARATLGPAACSRLSSVSKGV